MIWTLPVNMALSSTSTTTTTSISPVLQARSLSIACAFLKCLKGEVAIALTNNHCPGKRGDIRDYSGRLDIVLNSERQGLVSQILDFPIGG